MKKAGIFLFFSFLLITSTLLAYDKNLISVDSGYIDVRNGKLYYETTGNGEKTIVFIHDGLVHHKIWDSQFYKFAEEFKVVRYDRRGYGRSPRPENKFSNVEDLNQVFNYLRINKAILIGMSAGGRLAMDFTLKYPGKVSSLVLVGAVVSGFTYSNHFYTRGGRLKREDFSNREKLLKYYVKDDPYEIAPQHKEIKEKLWNLMKDNIQNIDFSNNSLVEPPEHPAVGILDQIHIPTLIVVGEFDIPDVFIHAGVIESGIPYAEKVIIQGAGHLVPFEQPEIFNEQVLNFLKSAEFFYTLKTQGVTEAVELFNKKNQDDNNWIPFNEARMNSLGYQHLQAGEIMEAIELFKLNVAAYPESSNVYDSLGESYMKNGDKERAIKNYEKSLELNPDNINAKEMLEQLYGIK